MTPRAARLAIIAVAAAFLILAAGWAAFFFLSGAREKAGGPPPPVEAAVPRAAEGPFRKQAPNRCGAYSLAEALRLRTGAPVDPAAIAAAIGHDVPGSDSLSGTLPWRIVEEARRRGLPAAGFSARADESDREKLDRLRRHIAGGRPVIVLIRGERDAQHYVLAVGYSPEKIDIYDPAADADPTDPTRTVDANGERPGNRTLEVARFLELWSQGGIAGLYTWWYAPI